MSRASPWRNKPHGENLNNVPASVPATSTAPKNRIKQIKQACKIALGLGCVVALLTQLTDPTAHSFTFLAGGLAALVLLVLLAPALARNNLLGARIPIQIVLPVLCLTLCTVLAEIGLRLFYSQRLPDPRTTLAESLGYRYDETLGWAPIPNSSKLLAGRRTITATHNSEGFRDPEPTMSEKPRIIFLGDSFVWGFDVEASDRFTEKLQAKHPEWTVYNFGVSGYSTDQEFLLLQKHLARYHPRVVFVVFCAENDEAGNSSNLGGPYFKPFYTTQNGRLNLNGIPVPRSENVFYSRHPFLSRSYLIRLALRAYLNTFNPPAHGSVASPTLAIFKEMQAYLKLRGVKLAVGTTDSEPRLERACHDLGIPWVDLATSERYAPGDHWTAKGHSVVSAKIEEFLLDGKYLDGGAGQSTPGSLNDLVLPVPIRRPRLAVY
jgi:hypothetical protein